MSAPVDEFDKASTNFITADDLDGRLLLVFPRSMGTRNGNNGQAYDYVESDTMVLDGPITDKIPAVGPDSAALEVRWSGTVTVGSLKSQLRKPKDPQGLYRPILGRLDGKPSTVNRNVKVYAFGEFDDRDREMGMKALATYRAGQEDPFA